MTDLGGFRSPQGDEFTALRVQFRPGGTFGLWFSLSLNGGFGVTITHVGWPADPYEKLPIVSVQRQPGDAGGTAGSSLVPLEPFSLEPDQEADVLVTIGMRGCVPESTSLEFGSIPVTYRFLGITQHTEVFLPESVEVVGQKGVTTCPA